MIKSEIKQNKQTKKRMCVADSVRLRSHREASWLDSVQTWRSVSEKLPCMKKLIHKSGDATFFFFLSFFFVQQKLFQSSRWEDDDRHFRKDGRLPNYSLIHDENELVSIWCMKWQEKKTQDETEVCMYRPVWELFPLILKSSEWRWRWGLFQTSR